MRPVTVTNNSATNISTPVPTSTISLSRSGFSRSALCMVLLPLEPNVVLGLALTRCPPGRATRLGIPTDAHDRKLPARRLARASPAQECRTPPGLAGEPISRAIHRLAHFLLKYCAEWLTLKAPIWTRITADETCYRSS